MSNFKTSVVLCTHNPREAYLRRVLDGLRAQTLPLDQWELLLVDNASKTPVSTAFDLTWHPHGNISREEKLGKMYAWFKGISDARGELLVFVDDDNVLDPNYLEQAIAIAEQKKILGMWGASVLPEFESKPPAWMQDHMWRLSIGEVREDVWSNVREGFETKPIGAGLCVRKEVAIHYLKWCGSNKMSYALDRKGNAITGYGEMNLALCAIDMGLGVGKFASLRLTHLIPSSRLTLDYLIRQAEGDAASLLLFRTIWGLPIEQPRDLLTTRIHWFFCRLLHRMTPESIKIMEAHVRGAKAGWEVVQKLRMNSGLAAEK